MHLMIAVVILRPTWIEPVADLYFDNDSTVYMEVNNSCLSAIIFISAEHKKWMWSDRHRKWGIFRPDPGIFLAALWCKQLRVIQLTAMRRDQASLPSVHHLLGSLRGEIPSDRGDSIGCRPPNIPPQTISLICSSSSLASPEFHLVCVSFCFVKRRQRDRLPVKTLFLQASFIKRSTFNLLTALMMTPLICEDLCMCVCVCVCVHDQT